MMKNISFVTVGLVLTCFTLQQMSAAITLTSDRTTWNNQVTGEVTTDTFGSNVSDAQSIVFASGVTSAGFNVGGDGFGLNRVNGGDWDGRIRTSVGTFGYESITWTFPHNVTSFALDFKDVAAGLGLQVTGNFDGLGSFDYNVSEGASFFGVLGTVEFNSLTISAAGATTTDQFSADNLAFNTPVPEPLSTSIFMLIGAAGFCGWRRYRSRDSKR